MPANLKENTSGQRPPVFVTGGDGLVPLQDTSVDAAATRGEGSALMPTFGTMKPGVSFKNVVTLNASPAARKYYIKSRVPP